MTVSPAPHGVGEVHPLLLKRQFPTIRNWHEWREVWDSVERPEFLHSLLHFGFDVPIEHPRDNADRICFYLALADGHSRPEGWDLSGEPTLTRKLSGFRDDRIPFGGARLTSQGALRREIARKAFHVLCGRFFKDTREDASSSPRDRFLLNLSVFEATFQFFRLEIDESQKRYQLINLEHGYEDKADHHFEIAREFALVVAHFIPDILLHNQNACDPGAQELYVRCKAALPRATDILFGLGKTGLLLESKYWLDPAVLERLKELVMNQWVQDEKGFHAPQNLDELICAGSHAALVLHALQLKFDARKRAKACS